MSSKAKFLKSKAVGEQAFLVSEGGKNRFQAAADSDWSDAERQPRTLVSLDQNGAERRLARSRLEPPQGNAGREPAERLLRSHADDGIVVAGHADIGYKGCPSREDPVVSARRVGVGSDNEACSSVAKVSGGVLLAGRLAMKVDDSRLDGATERVGIEFGCDAAERIFHRLHEQSPQRVDHESASSVFGFDQHGSHTGRAREIVDRPHKAGAVVNEL